MDAPKRHRPARLPLPLNQQPEEASLPKEPPPTETAVPFSLRPRSARRPIAISDGLLPAQKALRRLKGEVRRYLEACPNGPSTPLEQIAFAALKQELLSVLDDLRVHRDNIGRQMGQTSLRSKAASVYTKTFRTS